MKIVSLSDRYFGCLIGLAVGDALGLPFEYQKRDHITKQLQDRLVYYREFERAGKVFPGGFTSDDTAQMLCLAESLAGCGFNQSDQFENYKRWYRDGRHTPDQRAFGIGQHTLRVMMGQKVIPQVVDHGARGAGGNGALMRSAPIAVYCHHNKEDVVSHSILSAIVTHNSRLAADTCAFLNSFLCQVFEGVDKARLRTYLLNHGLDIHEVHCLAIKDSMEMKASDFQGTGSSLETLQIALWSFFSTESYHDAIHSSIVIGGDTDTYAAVTGAIAGAYYGIDGVPGEFTDELWCRDQIKSMTTMILSGQS